MSSIPAAVLAKSLIALTVSVHPAVYHGPASYVVRPGDTLSTIAGRAYGNTADWPAVWWANRRQVPDPDRISTGQRLQLPDSPRVPRWLARAALTATDFGRGGLSRLPRSGRCRRARSRGRTRLSSRG